MSSDRHIVPSTVPRLVRHAERSPLLTRLKTKAETPRIFIG